MNQKNKKNKKQEINWQERIEDLKKIDRKCIKIEQELKLLELQAEKVK